MATNNRRCWLGAALLAAAGVGLAAPAIATAPGGSREAASPAACQSAGTQPAVSAAKSALERNPDDVRLRFTLADAWSDAGCFNDAVQVLEDARARNPGNQEVATRLRVARSLVGEERFFDDLDRANADAKLKRAAFRCSSLRDLGACDEALAMKPADAALLAAQRDARQRAPRSADAGGAITAAAPPPPSSAPASSAAPGPAPASPAHPSTAALAATQAARAVAQRYSNAAPESQTH